MPGLDPVAAGQLGGGVDGVGPARREEDLLPGMGAIPASRSASSTVGLVT